MAEPTAAEVEAAEAAVRFYCGWHVAPVETTTVTLDGPGSRVLILPTLKLVEVTSIVEDEVEVDLDFVKWSVDGRVRKTRWSPLDEAWFGPRWGPYWWTGEFQGITATFRHGFSDAPDFDKAVTMVAESIAASGLRDDQSMTMKQVDDVRYQWRDSGVESIVGTHLLAPYRLEKTP